MSCTHFNREQRNGHSMREYLFLVSILRVRWKCGEPSPLFKRAWTFQERLLAPRVLSFTRCELLWECREASDCECCNGGNGLSTTSPNMDHAPALVYTDPRADSWLTMVKAYFALQLTYGRDKLPAIKGIVRNMLNYRPVTNILLAYGQIFSCLVCSGMLKEVQLALGRQFGVHRLGPGHRWIVVSIIFGRSLGKVPLWMSRTFRPNAMEIILLTKYYLGR
jgi:hypothetical protein